ncbi:uncharacterized protein LOC134280229 [Saccostrea cucullata]|uniref:uncharacterized protein LOC134280229 n=1 Tax=Saccostrea cuccullata TaxID=36930 RepID=UPI002ED58DF2
MSGLFYIFVILVAYQMDFQTVRGYTLMQHLSRQASNLQYGLNLANKYNHRYGGTGVKVAFSARTSGNYYYSSGNIIKFSYVYTNQGLCLKNGQYFSAPHSGLFAFSWSLRTYSSHVAYTSIRVNGYIRQKSLCYTGTTSYADSCSNTVVLSLNRGDNVGIYSDASKAYIASYYSSFAGWEL